MSNKTIRRGFCSKNIDFITPWCFDLFSSLGGTGKGEGCCKDQRETDRRSTGDHPLTQTRPIQQRARASEQQAGVGERASEPTASTGAGGGIKQ